MLGWLFDRFMARPPRRQCVDYHISNTLPDEILAIIRTTWYKNGRPVEVDELAILEDGSNGYAAFVSVVGSQLQQGANLSIRSAYNPEDLGIIRP